LTDIITVAMVAGSDSTEASRTTSLTDVITVAMVADPDSAEAPLKLASSSLLLLQLFLKQRW